LKSEPANEEVSPTVIDARGKPCPLPIVEVSRALRQLERCELWATDPATAADL